MNDSDAAILDDTYAFEEPSQLDAADAMWEEDPREGFADAAAGNTHAFARTLTNGQYHYYDWVRLGLIMQHARMKLGMSRNAFAYSIGASSKSVGRIEQGRIYGNPVTAPQGDYNTEKYVLRRAAFIEMTLEWGAGSVRAILDDPGLSAPPGAPPEVRSHGDVVLTAEAREAELAATEVTV
jgi:hypothetical protein